MGCDILLKSVNHQRVKTEIGGIFFYGDSEILLVQSVGAIEYTDCISAEE